MVTAGAAPEPGPMRSGEARGLRRRDWRKTPAVPRAAPTVRPARTRLGRRSHSPGRGHSGPAGAGQCEAGGAEGEAEEDGDGEEEGGEEEGGPGAGGHEDRLRVRGGDCW